MWSQMENKQDIYFWDIGIVVNFGGFVEFNFITLDLRPNYLNDLHVFKEF